MQKVSNVDEYIAQAPLDVQSKLKQIRKVIQDVAPDATESMSYGMPYYSLNGRLAYFANAKHHIGLYIPPPIIENNKEDLKQFVFSKSAVQFPLEKKLPITLIQKLVRARIKHNEEHKK